MSFRNKVQQYNDFLTDENFNQLKDYVNTLNFSKPSFVFNIPNKENVIDEKVRKSQTVITDDKSIVNFTKNVILKIPDVNMKMVNNYVTFIKYEEGGFFDWHNDFSKFTINKGTKFVECHFLFCIEEPEEGGDLLIRDKSYEYKKNSVIMFDKSQDHKADVVKKGTKIIMTVDVLTSSNKDHIYEPIDVNEYLEFNKLTNNFGALSYNLNFIESIYNEETDVMFAYLNINGRIIIYDKQGIFYFNNKDEYDTYLVCKENDYPSNYEIKDLSINKIAHYKDDKIVYVGDYYDGDYDYNKLIEEEATYLVCDKCKEDINPDTHYVHNLVWCRNYRKPKYKYTKLIDELFDESGVIETLTISKYVLYGDEIYFNDSEKVFLPKKFNGNKIPDNTNEEELLKLIKVLPTSFNGQKPEEITYGYHCNQEEYDQVVIDMMYGIIRKDKLTMI